MCEVAFDGADIAGVEALSSDSESTAADIESEGLSSGTVFEDLEESDREEHDDEEDDEVESSRSEDELSKCS